MISRGMLAASAGLILLGAMAGGALIGWWLFNHMDAHLLLQDQAVTIRLPKPVQVQAEVPQGLDVLLHGKLATTVPIDQSITVPISDTLHVVADFDHDVPIKMTVPIHQSIPVDQVIHVDSKVDVVVLGHTIRLPVKGDIPVMAQVPVSLDVPVDQSVRLRFSAPIDARLNQSLHVPVKTNVSTTIALSGQLHVPVQSAIQASVTIAGPLDAVLTHADLKLPLHTLSLGLDSTPAAGAQP